jgi:hypothetical protein
MQVNMFEKKNFFTFARGRGSKDKGFIFPARLGTPKQLSFRVHIPTEKGD